MPVVREDTEPKGVVSSSETMDLRGPNRDQGSLLSFAIKGDLAYRILTHTETKDQALVVTAPEGVIRKMAYDIVKAVEQADTSRAKTRPKKDS